MEKKENFVNFLTKYYFPPFLFPNQDFLTRKNAQVSEKTVLGGNKYDLLNLLSAPVNQIKEYELVLEVRDI